MKFLVDTYSVEIVGSRVCRPPRVSSPAGQLEVVLSGRISKGAPSTIFSAAQSSGNALSREDGPTELLDPGRGPRESRPS